MSSWNWIGKDDGRSGLEWRVKIEHGVYWVWIPGTDHPDDVAHHLQTGWVWAHDGVRILRADYALAREVVDELHLSGDESVIVGGHSWGGAVAALIVWILLRRGVDVRGFLYAPKRAGNRAFVDEIAPYITAYRHRGDWIPYLPPWYARFTMRVFGRWTWPWKAHMPDRYADVMEKDGF